MKVSAASYSTKGLLRKINQDNILLTSFKSRNDNVWLAVVCDGVGGLDGGEVASSFVIEAFSEWFKSFSNDSLAEFDMYYSATLNAFARKVNTLLYNMGRTQGRTFGTTLTALLIIGKYYYVLHVGDTRVYFIESGSIQQLTKDHTRHELIIDRGDIDSDEKNNKNIIWQCIGGSYLIEPQIFRGTVKSGTFLICSDGFRDEVSEYELLDKIGSTKIRTSTRLRCILEELIELNLERNEKDNISAILIDMDIE